MYVADPRFAEESVTPWRGRSGPVRRTLQPGQHWVTPLASAEVQRWRISQGTEPQTVTAAVRIAPSRRWELEPPQPRRADPHRHRVVGGERLGRPAVALDQPAVLLEVDGQLVRGRVVALRGAAGED